MKTIAIITARGGSKGIPGKNIKLLNHKPLIAYSIEAALQCDFIDKVVVSTDSIEIAEIAKAFGADVPFLRPAELAQDTSKSIDSIIHAIDYYKSLDEHYDDMILLQPTSPLRTASDIEECYRHYICTGRSGLCSVSLCNIRPILIRYFDKDGSLKSLLGKNSTVRRQDDSRYYSVDGSVYIYPVSKINPSCSLNDAPNGCILPKNHTIDIDTIEDFNEAELMLQKRLGF